MTEIRCSRDLALWLGAVQADTPAQHRALRSAGQWLIRDRETSTALFWRAMIGCETVTARSSG